MNLSNLFEKKKTSLDYLKEISEKQSAANDIAAQAERAKADAIVEAAREKTPRHDAPQGAGGACRALQTD